MREPEHSDNAQAASCPSSGYAVSRAPAAPASLLMREHEEGPVGVQYQQVVGRREPEVVHMLGEVPPVERDAGLVSREQGNDLAAPAPANSHDGVPLTVAVERG